MATIGGTPGRRDTALGAGASGGALKRALPRVRRFGGRLYAVLLAILVPLAIVAPLVSAWEDYQRNRNPVWLPVGINIWQSPTGVGVEAPLSQEARASDLRPGDRILAIDGRAVPPSDPASAVRPWLNAKQEGETVRLTVQTGRSPPRDVSLTKRDRHRTEPFEAVGVSWTVAITLPVLGGLLPSLFLVPAALLLLRRRGELVPGLLAVALLLISATTWADVFWRMLGLPLLGARLGSLAWSSLLAAMLLFPSGHLEPRWTRWLAGAIAIWAILDVSFELPGAVVQWTTLLLMGGALFALATRYRRLPQGVERQQLRWAFLGFAFGASCFLAVTVLRSVWEANIHHLSVTIWLNLLVPLIGAAGACIFVSGLIVSLLRYRLYDVDAAISRSAAVAVVTLTLAAVYAGSSELLENSMEARWGRDAGAWPGAMGAALAVLLFVPLNNRIQAWAERRFRKGLASLQRDLPDCVNDLRETARLGELLDEVLERVTDGVRASRGALVICGKLAAAREVGVAEVQRWQDEHRPDETADTLDCAPADALFPMRVKLRVRHGREEPIGWILLGPRPDGSFYGKDEREALAEITDPVARAVQIALRREAREEEALERYRQQNARLDALERKLSEALTRRAETGRPLSS